MDKKQLLYAIILAFIIFLSSLVLFFGGLIMLGIKYGWELPVLLFIVIVSYAIMQRFSWIFSETIE